MNSMQLNNKNTMIVKTRMMTKNLAKIKKLTLMMHMKGLISSRRMYYAPSKKNSKYPEVGYSLIELTCSPIQGN